MDLCKVAPRFLMADEVPNGVDVCRLIAEFSDYTEAIVAIVNVEQILFGTTCLLFCCSSFFVFGIWWWFKLLDQVPGDYPTRTQCPGGVHIRSY